MRERIPEKPKEEESVIPEETLSIQRVDFHSLNKRLSTEEAEKLPSNIRPEKREGWGLGSAGFYG